MNVQFKTNLLLQGDTTMATIQINLDLARYSENDLYRLLGMGIISSTEFKTELERRDNIEESN